MTVATAAPIKMAMTPRMIRIQLTVRVKRVAIAAITPNDSSQLMTQTAAARAVLR